MFTTAGHFLFLSSQSFRGVWGWSIHGCVGTSLALLLCTACPVERRLIFAEHRWVLIYFEIFNFQFFLHAGIVVTLFHASPDSSTVGPREESCVNYISGNEVVVLQPLVEKFV